jgi:hypothetical protein
MKGAIETEPGYIERTLSNLSARAIYGTKIVLSGLTAGGSYFAIAAPTASVLMNRGVIESASRDLILKRAIPGFTAAVILFGVICEGVYGFSELKKTNQTTYPGAAGRGLCLGGLMYLGFLDMFLKHKILFL